jgi:hypothetical protein
MAVTRNPHAGWRWNWLLFRDATIVFDRNSDTGSGMNLFIEINNYGKFLELWDFQILGGKATILNIRLIDKIRSEGFWSISGFKDPFV